MINLNPFAISGILVTVTSLPLFFFIILKGKKMVAKIYALNILTIALWGIGSFLIAICKNPETAIILWKNVFISVLFIPIFLLHAVYLLTKSKRFFPLNVAYIVVFIFVFLDLSDGLFSTVNPMFEIYFLKGNETYSLTFLFWETIVIWAHLKLFIYYRNSFPKEKKQIICLIFASIGFMGGSMNFLPNMGIPIYPVGNFLAPLYCIMVTYAIYKHQLLDIEIAYKKGISYSILFAIITLGYLLIVISAEKILQHYWGYSSTTLSIFAAFAIGVLFIPLRNKIQEITDHFFFNASHIQMINENQLLKQELAQTEKLRTVATFASGMAHEIKNPLTAIKTFVEYLPAKSHDKDFINKFVPIVNNEVEKINELVHDLLDYAKPSPLKPTSFDLHKIIEDTLLILTNQAVDKKIKIVKEFDTNPIIFLADTRQIKQALVNIFINALDAMASGATLLITTKFQKTIVDIQITDTGCGISKNDLPHIFDPFFTKKENGTGLGLSITHGIIKEHDGKIFVESEVGRGTTFRIELPIKKED